MTYSSLIDRNIFIIPIGDLWETEENRVNIVYSPLNGRSILATNKTVEELIEASRENRDNEILKKITEKNHIPIYHLPKSIEDVNQIDILSNYTCNFKCVYCYSAAGRSSKEIDFTSIKAMVDYLFRSGRKQTKPYIINFSGGGEPLLSFPLIQKTVEYIVSVAKGTNYEYRFGIVTNGSLITPEIAQWLKEQNIGIAVSFEILKQFQEKERGSYEKVVANMDMMAKLNVPFGIRTTFTPESVHFMSDMVKEVSVRFPYLDSVVFDVVLSPDIFKTPAELSNYYNDFLKEFYIAKELGRKLTINVESIAVETCSIVRDRTCQGKLVLTPMGSISACSRISSPQEELYDKYTYSEIVDGKIHFDEEKFSQIMSENTIYSQSFCHDCYAKWNCGGGCRLFHHSFSSDFLQAKCDFSRRSLKIELFNILSDKYLKSQRCELHQYIAKKIEQGEI